MSFKLDLGPNVPVYGQEDCCWCGAASGQMSMNGYPDPAHRMFFAQLDIWNTIQAYNSKDPADMNWCTDPYGLRDCMMTLNPPPNTGHWIAYALPDRDMVMYWILRWMNQFRYPVPTLINNGGHWVVITGYESDVSPDASSTVNLLEIQYHDPEPHFVGTHITKAGPIWYQDEWIGPIYASGTWKDQYVAVIEPPEVKGRIKVAKVERIGRKMISPQHAIEGAQKWLSMLDPEKHPVHAVLLKKGITPLLPILVREEIGTIEHGGERKRVPYYYVVPFGDETVRDKNDMPLVRAGIIINAYTGEFEEIGSFGKPVSYLPAEKAIAIAARALHLKKDALKDAKAVSMFQPSEITHIRMYPFWKVTIGDQVLYIDQRGKIYKAIIPSRLGD